MVSENGLKVGMFAVAIIVVASLGVSVYTGNISLPDAGISKPAQKFSSIQELSDFLASAEKSGSAVFGGVGDLRTLEAPTAAPQAAAEDSSGGSQKFSTTNIQVEGVDEADIVKTNGNYIYIVSGKKLLIVKAYPAEEMEIISETEFDGTAQEIFINGNKIVVFGNSYEEVETEEIYYYPYYQSNAFVKVYDASNKAELTLVKDLELEGSYTDSRMIGNYVYTIIDSPVRAGAEPIPLVTSDGNVIEKGFPEVYHFDYPTYQRFVTIMSLDLQSLGDPQTERYLMDYAQNVYVSQNNIYVSYTKYVSQLDYMDRLLDEAILPLVPATVSVQINAIREKDLQNWEKYDEIGEVLQDYFNTLSIEQQNSIMSQAEERAEPIMMEIQKESQKTVIHKIGISNGNIEYKAHGEAPGNLLNQFSMDESNGYLRVATTTNENRVFFGRPVILEAAARGTSTGMVDTATVTAMQIEDDELEDSGIEDSKPLPEPPLIEPSPTIAPPQPPSMPRSYNHVYVLDENLEIVGKLENIAPDESIYSARFIGNRLYLVTFVKVDPLFVIDFSDPTAPRVLGELKIPGFSNYLHPYDENHIIGIGKDATDASGRMLFQGVKLALFDVSDVSNPRLVSDYIIGKRGTDSEALYEHKAFLFDREKNLLVIPVQVAENQDYKTSFVGAYVFSLTPQDGFTLRGEVGHDTTEQVREYYYNYNYVVKRSLYIGDVLYTMSNKMLKANSLKDLSELASIDLPIDQEREVFPILRAV